MLGYIPSCLIYRAVDPHLFFVDPDPALQYFGLTLKLCKNYLTKSLLQFWPPKKAISTDNWVSAPIFNIFFYPIRIINNFPAFFLKFFPPGSGSSFRKRSWIWIQDGKLLQIHGDPTPQPWEIYFMQSQALAIPPSLGFGRIFFCNSQSIITESGGGFFLQ